MDEITITYHSENYDREKHPAVNVKDYHVYARDSRFTDYSEEEFEVAYEDCREAFWNFFAPEVAKRFGYGDVYSEGRMGGWLVVENPPTFDERDDENMTDGEARENAEEWNAFEQEILSEMDYCCNQRLLDVLQQARAAKAAEAAETAAMAARDIPTVD